MLGTMKPSVLWKGQFVLYIKKYFSYKEMGHIYIYIAIQFPNNRFPGINKISSLGPIYLFTCQLYPDTSTIKIHEDLFNLTFEGTPRHR